MARSLRAALLGLGKMGRIRARTLRQLGVEIVAAADPNPDTHAAFAPLPCETAPAALFDGPADLVCVSAPNCFAADLVCGALAAGKHVFCEKPPGTCLADAERMQRAEQARPGLKLQFGLNHRHHGSVRTARQWIQEGRIGALTYMRGLYGKAAGHDFLYQWRNDPEVSGGGILIDQGIHLLDLIGWLGGPVELVGAHTATLQWPIPVEDEAALLLRSQRGWPATLHSTANLSCPRFSLEIGGTAGTLDLEGVLSSTGIYAPELIRWRNRSTGRTSAASFMQDDSWVREMDLFLDTIETGGPVATGSSGDALALMQIIEAAYAAGRGLGA